MWCCSPTPLIEAYSNQLTFPYTTILDGLQAVGALTQSGYDRLIIIQPDCGGVVTLTAAPHGPGKEKGD